MKAVQLLNNQMKYKNEMQIKKAMGIENWRNLSRDKVIRFAAMMPDMDKETKKFYENLNRKYVKATVAVFTNRSKSAAQRNRHDLSHAGFAVDFIYFLMGFCLNRKSLYFLK